MASRSLMVYEYSSVGSNFGVKNWDGLHSQNDPNYQNTDVWDATPCIRSPILWISFNTDLKCQLKCET